MHCDAADCLFEYECVAAVVHDIRHGFTILLTATRTAEAKGRPRITADDVDAAITHAALPSLLREMDTLQQKLNAIRRRSRDST